MDEREFVNAYLENDSHVVALYRNEVGRVFGKRFRAEFASFHESVDLDADVRRVLRSSRHVRGLREEGKWTRITWASRQSREDAMQDERSPFRKGGIASYEGDLDPITRWLVDEKIKIARPRRCYLDVETDSRVSFSEKKKMRVLCWSLADETKQIVARGQLNEDTDEDEKRILDLFWASIANYDQVVCWNGSYGGKAFDFEIVELRSEARGVKFDMRRGLWVDQLPVFASMNAHAAESGEEKQSMKLGDIAQELLGHGKEQTPDFVRARFGDRCDRGLGALAWELWVAGGEFRDLLFRYNENDTTLLPEIEAETGYLDLLSALAETCGIFPDDRAIDATRRVDGFMLRLGSEEGHRFATKRRDEEQPKKFKGALVTEPKTLDPAWRKKMGMRDGIARDVHVFDFSGMYPSIILAWNMSPETRAPVPINGPVPEGHTRSPLTGIGFRLDEEGFLVKALRVLLKQREFWTDKKASLTPGTDEWQAAGRMSDAYKIAINAFYGVVGSPFSRYFDRAVAESVAQNGVWLILKVIEEVEKRGWESIYSDTDSCYVIGPTREQAKEFADWCTRELFPPAVREVGCVECPIKLAYEKQLSRIVFTSMKRYCASLLHYKGKDATKDSRPEVKGIEYKRGDASKLTRMLQERAIDMLVGGLKIIQDVPTDDLARYHELIAESRRHVLEDPLTLAEVRMSKSLSKPIREYVTKEKKGGGMAEPPAHVRIAKELKKRGRAVGVGTRIEFIVQDGSVSPANIIPAEDFDGTNVDRYHVWENVVFPPTERLLAAAYPDHEWSSWGKVRPPKARGRSSRAPEGQIALGELPLADLGETSGAAPQRGATRLPKATLGPLFDAVKIPAAVEAVKSNFARMAEDIGDLPGVLAMSTPRETSKTSFQAPEDHDPERPSP